jgi:hypothetical protein
LSETRIVLFYVTIVAVAAAAAFARIAVGLAARPVARLAVLAVLLAVAADVARSRSFRAMGAQPQREDLGPLVRAALRERLTDERVLFYDRSGYIYAYYAEADPVVLVPAPQNSIGYVPRITSATPFSAATLRARIVEALGASERVWVLASRIRPEDAAPIEAALAAGAVLRRDERLRATLVLVGRRQS